MIHSKKGWLFHLTLVGILLAIGIVLLLTFKNDLQAGVKGEWQYTFLKEGPLAGEKQLLGVDQRAAFVSERVAEQLAAQGGFLEMQETDCGRENGVSYWNRGDTFCFPVLEPAISELFTRIWKEEPDDPVTPLRNFNYTVTTDGHELVGTAAGQIIPVAYTALNYSLYYTVPPHFRVSLPEGLQELEELPPAALRLLEACRNEPNLESCIDARKDASWKYTSCAQEAFPAGTRHIPFCVSGAEEYHFGLDFTSGTVLPVEEFAVSCSIEYCRVTFPASAGSSYNLYFTNWEGVVNNQGSSEEVFAAIVPELGYFYQKVPITVPSEDCTLFEIGQPYLCDGEFHYVLQDAALQASGTYYFTVTAIQDSRESVITHFESATIS